MTTLDRRNRGDRRRRPTPPLSRYLLVGGRRVKRRRIDDPPAYYVDRLGAKVWFTLLSIFLFQVLDANLTLHHIERGGVELNPLMGHLISIGEGTFFAVKLAIAALGLFFLGIHKNYPMVRPGLGAIFVIFAGVVGWHCVLAFRTY
jgi:hypothetical protein